MTPLRRAQPMLALLLAATACSPSRPGSAVASPRTGAPGSRPSSGAVTTVAPEHEGRLGENSAERRNRDRIVLVALDGAAAAAAVSSGGAWEIDEQGGKQSLVRGDGEEQWRVESGRGGLLRVAGSGGDATPWRQGPFVARALAGDGTLRYAGKRYRGELLFTATDSGVLVVNRVPVEDYLRGVVPLELGTRNALDRAALEAQAIAARSYTMQRVPADPRITPRNGWHVTAGVSHQVYGGVDAEHPVVDAAVRSTAGLVLRYNGLMVDAPYSSSCGGRTASPRDVWDVPHDEPYLQSVDDIDPVTRKPYCDLSPRNHWTEEYDAETLRAVVARALAAAGSRAPSAASVQGMTVAARTVSGRVGAFTIRTERGDVAVRANVLRTVIRTPRGALLQSTNFTVDEVRTGSRLARVMLRGHGNGHGVGMCQWGAIGRSRAGQDARAILRHYYPGTSVGFAD